MHVSYAVQVIKPKDKISKKKSKMEEDQNYKEQMLKTNKWQMKKNENQE